MKGDREGGDPRRNDEGAGLGSPGNTKGSTDP
jgi:hypothetical protein